MSISKSAKHTCHIFRVISYFSTVIYVREKVLKNHEKESDLRWLGLVELKMVELLGRASEDVKIEQGFKGRYP